VINHAKLIKEIQELEDSGFQVKNNLFIDKRVHVVKEEYILEDMKDSTIGTTKTGNGPTYREKYNRTGLRVENYPELSEYVIDIYDILHGEDEVKVLFEGAQGFELDIDWGDYPYVTSSNCTVAGALQNGVPYQKVRNVYGIAKAYRTYVGNKKFEEPSDIFQKIREVGNEYGATTGRPRQINWFNLDIIKKAININGVTHIIINKIDVLDLVNTYSFVDNDSTINVFKKDDFKYYIEKNIRKSCQTVESIIFSESPYGI
jgi:adenylosuccinate synthase